MGVHLISFQITDAGGKTRSVVMPTADSETYAAICAFVLEVDSLLDAVIGGYISNASVQMTCPLGAGLATSATADYHVSDGGLLSFGATGTAYRSSIYVPTYDRALIDDNKSIADAGATQALQQAILGGVNVTITDKWENALSSFLGGSGVHRK